MTFVKESVTCTRCGASWETIPDMSSPHFCLNCMSKEHTRATPLNAWVRQNSKAEKIESETEFNENDRVWSKDYGHGVVIEKRDDIPWPILVRFYHENVCYTKDGRTEPNKPISLHKLNGTDRNYDAINPDHYKDGSMEVWQQMVQLYGIDKYLAFCELNAFKYRMRAGKKQGNSAQQDIEKALWYESKIKELKS